jgi:transposase
LTPMPYASGDSTRDQGISKAGNRRIRSLMIQIAWGWLRYQPPLRPQRLVQYALCSGRQAQAAHWHRGLGPPPAHCSLAVRAAWGDSRERQPETALA